MKSYRTLGITFHARADSGGNTQFEKLKELQLFENFWNDAPVKLTRNNLFMRNRESAFLKKGIFFDGELRSSVEFLIEAVEAKTSVFVVVRRLKL